MYLNVIDVTENITDVNSHVIEDKNDDKNGQLMGNLMANKRKTIGKYWKVYDRRGSYLIHTGTVSFDEFDPSQATPIQMNTFSNHTVGFEREYLLSLSQPT